MCENKKRYWHEYEDNIQIPIDKWDEVMINFQRPKWCGYENALKMGKCCLTLMNKRNRINERFCSGCDKFIGGILHGDNIQETI